jgi:hypothetical protein
MAKGKMSTAKAIKETLKKKKKKPAPQVPKTIKKLENLPEAIHTSDEDCLENCDLAGDMTLRELKFVEIYLSGQINLDKAMILAGYEEYSETYRARLGTKIIRKYECQTDDHRKIMRALGWGEVRVIQSLIEAATGFKSEQVRLNARLGLAKCLGIQKETLESVEGISIVINSSRGLSPQPQPGQHRPAKVNQDQPPALPAPISITK